MTTGSPLDWNEFAFTVSGREFGAGGEPPFNVRRGGAVIRANLAYVQQPGPPLADSNIGG